MPSIIKTAIKMPDGPTIIMEAPYFDEFLRSASEEGRLTRDVECHALFYYYGMATKAFLEAKANLVEESDLSRLFNRDVARNLMQSIAMRYGVRADQMVRFWPIVHQQRIAMGGDDNLPAEFQFRFWGN